MDLQLKGKTALVTGASQGIGRAIAKGLAAEGVKTCIAARRRELLEQLAREIVAAPINRKVVIPDSLIGKIPLGDEQLKKLVRIDRAEMNRQLDNWTELWNREIEGKR